MRVLDLNGDVISNDDAWLYEWFGMDYISPSMVRSFLDESAGEEIRVNINSPGGNLYEGVNIHDMLKSYSGKLTIHISGCAASAASIIAMARECYMSPGSMMMIHNVSTMDYGNKFDKTKSADVLSMHDKAIVALYAAKTGLPEDDIMKMVNETTWLTAKDAVEKGFIDGIDSETVPVMMNSLTHGIPKDAKNKLKGLYLKSKGWNNDGEPEKEPEAKQPTEPAAQSDGVPVEQLRKRLELLRRK